MKRIALYQSLPLKFNTLRFKISILYVAVIGLVLILIQGILFYNYVNSISRQFDTQLQNKAEQVGGAVNTFRSMLSRQKQPFRSAVQKALNLNIEYPNYFFMTASPEKFWLADARKLGLEHDSLVIMDRQGNIIGNSRNVDKALLLYFKTLKTINFNKDTFYRAKVNGRILRIITDPYFYTYKQGYIIAVASPYQSVESAILRHLLFSIVSTSLFLVIASLVVRIFVISVLSSVLEISNVARNITQENLSARIKLTHTDEEIEHLTGSLNEMIARLEKSFAHVKEFSLEMAHEVKTPLAIISGESQMALEKNYSAKEYKEVFSIVLKEARRTQQFISDLLLLTKLDYRIIQLRFAPLDIAEFLRGICNEMRVIAAPKGVVIQEEIPQGPLFLKGDKIHLGRVFYNLIDNALKFTPKGGRIDLVLKSHKQTAIIFISDTGSGIAHKDLSKIFTKFNRVVNSGKEEHAGCGLGLNIAYSIIKLHQGNITVSSKVEKGTTFKIEVPLV